MKRILVHIDRLVLRGINRYDVAAVTAGLETELQRLLASEDGVDALAARDALRAVRSGAVRVPLGSAAATVGRSVAAWMIRGARR